MLVWCLLKNVWVRQVANSFIQFISQAPCITLVQFHINCYLKKKNFHHSGLQPDLITWPHSPGLMDGLEWMTWSLYKIKRNVFHLLYTSFCFLLGPYLKRINTFNNVLRFCFHSCWSVFFTTICQLHLFDFWSILIKRLLVFKCFSLSLFFWPFVAAVLYHMPKWCTIPKQHKSPDSQCFV